MASVTRSGSSYRVRFLIGSKRCSVGLGRATKSESDIAKTHVEHLVDCHGSERPPVAATLRWLDSLDDGVYDRLAAYGLCESRERVHAPRKLLAYFDHYISTRSDWKKPENYKQAVAKLRDYLGRDIALGGLTQGEVEKWQRWMVAEGLSPNTAGQNVKRCNQMMREAMKCKLVSENPFAGVKIDLSSDKSKNRFIDATTAATVLEACIDQEWRTLFALSRFAGLRCPSEVLSLRWNDIHWDRNRFKVTSPKTERYGKSERIVPLWPELRAELETLFAMVSPGLETPADAHVITRYRCSESNLRTQFKRIVQTAGVTTWQKPFMALRASRRTELEQTGLFTNHALNEWFGHSGAVAEMHYLQVTESDFATATKLTVSLPQGSGTNSGTSGHISEPSGNEQVSENPEKTGVLMGSDGSRNGEKYTQEDSRSVGKTLGKCHDSEKTGTNSGTSEGILSPSAAQNQLQELAKILPQLDDKTRAEIVSIARERLALSKMSDIATITRRGTTDDEQRH